MCVQFLRNGALLLRSWKLRLSHSLPLSCGEPASTGFGDVGWCVRRPSFWKAFHTSHPRNFVPSFYSTTATSLTRPKDQFRSAGVVGLMPTPLRSAFQSSKRLLAKLSSPLTKYSLVPASLLSTFKQMSAVLASLLETLEALWRTHSRGATLTASTQRLMALTETWRTLNVSSMLQPMARQLESARRSLCALLTRSTLHESSSASTFPAVSQPEPFLLWLQRKAHGTIQTLCPPPAVLPQFADVFATSRPSCSSCELTHANMTRKVMRNALPRLSRPLSAPAGSMCAPLRPHPSH